MAESPQAPSLAELASAVASSRADDAVGAVMAALASEVPFLEILRTAAVAAARHYDPSAGVVPHGLLALSTVPDLRELLAPRHQPLPLLQAVQLAASEKKGPAPPLPPVISGEVTHLGRSALLAARAGDLASAESLFLGIVEEGWERRMAGDVLFRAAAEDLGDGGHKLLVAVRLWQLARTLGFRDARTILRPAVQYLVRGERSTKAYDTTMAVLGRDRVDLESLGSGVLLLDEPGTAKLATLLASPTAEGCVTEVLGLLRSGCGPASILEGFGIEAAKRTLAAEGYHLEVLHGLLYADAARFAVEFSRTSDRLHILFQTALRVRSPAPHLPSVSVAEPADEDAALRLLTEDLETRRPREAAARVRLHLARGYSPKALLSNLAYHASLDASLANGGHNLLLAKACAAEFTGTHAPEFLMTLAKCVAASPRDLTASKAWSARLGP